MEQERIKPIPYMMGPYKLLDPNITYNLGITNKEREKIMPNVGAQTVPVPNTVKGILSDALHAITEVNSILENILQDVRPEPVAKGDRQAEEAPLPNSTCIQVQEVNTLVHNALNKVNVISSALGL